MMSLLAMALAASGFVCLCASMKRHQRKLLGRRLNDRGSAGVRLAGFALLASALGIDLWAISVSQGAIYWCGHLTIGALVGVAVLELRKHTGGKTS